MSKALLKTLRGLLVVINQASATGIDAIDEELEAETPPKPGPDLQNALDKISRGGSDLPPMLGQGNVPEPPPDQE